MTPVAFHLPLSPADAAALAGLVIDQTQGKRITGDLRRRLAAQAASMNLETLTPWLGPLERDPVHPDACYTVVDAVQGGTLLLHMAPASTPASGLYPKSLLIGRMRTPAGSEIVVNAIPFGPADTVNVRRYAERVNPAFLPRACGARTSLSVSGDLAAAFDAFRSILRKHALNVAAASPYDAALWAAIRAGWREGWSAEARLPAGTAGVKEFAACTRFACEAADLEGYVRIYAAIRAVKAASPTGRAFDFVPVLAAPVVPEHLAATLEALKARGCPAQFVAVPLDFNLPPQELGEFLRELAAAARRHGALLSVEPERCPGAEALEAIGKATGGRVNFRVPGAPGAADIEWVAERLMV